MKYKAVRDSYGYMGRFWKKDDILIWHEGMPIPPRHFEPVDGQKPAPAAAAIQEPEKKRPGRPPKTQESGGAE